MKTTNLLIILSLILNIGCIGYSRSVKEEKLIEEYHSEIVKSMEVFTYSAILYNENKLFYYEYYFELPVTVRMSYDEIYTRLEAIMYNCGTDIEVPLPDICRSFVEFDMDNNEKLEYEGKEYKFSELKKVAERVIANETTLRASDPILYEETDEFSMYIFDELSTGLSFEIIIDYINEEPNLSLKLDRNSLDLFLL